MIVHTQAAPRARADPDPRHVVAVVPPVRPNVDALLKPEPQQIKKKRRENRLDDLPPQLAKNKRMFHVVNPNSFWQPFGCKSQFRLSWKIHQKRR